MKQLDLEAYIQFCQRLIKCREVTRQRKGIWAPRGYKLWENQHMGETMVGKDFLVRFVMQREVGALFSDKSCLE